MVAEEPKAPLTQPFLHSRRQLRTDWKHDRQHAACFAIDRFGRRVSFAWIDLLLTITKYLTNLIQFMILGCKYVVHCLQHITSNCFHKNLFFKGRGRKKFQIEFGSKELCEPKIILGVIKWCLCVEFIPSLSPYFCPYFIIILEMLKKFRKKNRVLSEVQVGPWSINASWRRVGWWVYSFTHSWTQC
jgi:hypothetical protein